MDEIVRGFRLRLGAIDPIERGAMSTVDPCDIETVEKLLLGPDAPLRNDGRFSDYHDYIKLLHFVHGA